VLEGSLDNFEPLLELHAERLRAQHVIYTEIAMGSSELPRDYGELLDRMQRFRAFVEKIEQGRLQMEFLVTFGRNRPPERLADVAQRLLVLHRAGLAMGLMIAGPEAGHPIAPFKATLERLHGEGVGIEVHAGEWAGPESVWDALDNGFPDRIGHGVAAFRDPRLVDALRERGVHLEFCPTSNRKTGAIAEIRDLPVLQARAAGISFSINTDDPGAFECSMNGEHALLAETFGLTEQDFHKIAVNALNARFQPRLRYVPSVGATLGT
jgi:adenosine deaminase